MYRLDETHGIRTLGWLAPLVLILVFIYRSTDSTLTLRKEPPPEFLEVRPEWKAEQRDAEACLARAYWQIAVHTMQWKYRPGIALPENPPREFHLGPDQGGCSLRLSVTSREHYWRQLRKVWLHPGIWKKRYTWDTSWFARGT